jgi:hypothetical protein
MIYAGDSLRLSTFEIVGFLDAGLSRCSAWFTIRPVVGSRRGSSVARGGQRHFVCFLTDSACLPERMGKT